MPADILVDADLLDHTLLRPVHAPADVALLTGGAFPSPVAVATRAPAAVAQTAAASMRVLAPASAAPATATQTAVLDASADHDGTTVLSADVVALRRRLPDWAGHSVLAARAPVGGTVTPAVRAVATPARLAMSTGERVLLNRPVLIGRAPQATRVHSTQVPRLVTVPSPLQDISRTHAEVRMDGDDVVLTDLHSTNGVLVVRCDAGPQRLQPGEATVLQPGVLVDLGEGVTFTVERGA